MSARAALTVWAAFALLVPRSPGAPTGVDLEVTYIGRAPMYERYRVDYPGGKPVLRAGTENARRWPTNGESATFTAYLANKGNVASGQFSYTWAIDGEQVASGSHPGLSPGQIEGVSYQWNWAHEMDGERVVDDHTVRCTVDPNNDLPETFENNNSVDDYINAMALYLAITPAMYQTYAQPAKTNLPYSAEHWLQRQIAAMNRSFAGSTYPVAPNGALERVRINVIEVRTNNPAQYTNDGTWFVNADYRVVSGGYDRVEDIDWSLVHELSHQLGLIDIYNYNVESDSVLVLGTEGLPCNFAFSWPRADLMGGGDIAPHTDSHLYSSFSAGGMNSCKGFRRGYYGEFQFDIPRTNYVLVTDNGRLPAAGVMVDFYFRQSGEIDNAPDISRMTDADGRFLLPNQSVGGEVTTRTGHTLRNNPFGIIDVVGGRNTFLIRLRRGSHEEFVWRNLTEINLAYWLGNTNEFELRIASHLPSPAAPAAPRLLNAKVEGQRVTLCWESVPGATGYRVYAAYSPEYQYLPVSSVIATSCFQVTAQSQNRVYVVTSRDAAGHESAFSPFAWLPRLINPAAVGIARDGTRIILDPQNGHALLEQRWDGRFIRNIGSVHYHFENSRFLSIDRQDRLLISHPADAYSSRHSVRVADRNAEGLLEFGQRGSGPGEFETPTGVAAFGTPATISGPWQNDPDTLLLLHFDGTYSGGDGETGTSVRTSFTPGRFAEGVLVTNTASLAYPTDGNMQRESGAIEFWFRPNWNGNDGVARYFVSSGAAFVNGFQIVKDGANNLRLLMWRGSRESGVGYGIGSWRIGEWHHVAVTWTTNRIALFVDGQQRSSSTNVAVPDQLDATLFIGSSVNRTSQANGLIDEFRISAIPRVGNSDTADYRIVVADSGNNRIQLFDEIGGFLAAFGGPGAGAGQFNDPRGVAIDSAGRILVADRNNNRVQVVTLEGTNFAVSPVVLTGLSRPIGLTTFRDSHWIVADTMNNRIKVFGINGMLLGSLSGPNDEYTGSFLQPAGVIVDGSGRIVVADTGNDRIVTLRGLFPTNAPPRFLAEHSRWNPERGFQSRLLTSDGQRIIVQATSDFLSWQPVTNGLANGTNFDFTDRELSPMRSYRAVTP